MSDWCMCANCQRVFRGDDQLKLMQDPDSGFEVDMMHACPHCGTDAYLMDITPGEAVGRMECLGRLYDCDGIALTWRTLAHWMAEDMEEEE